MKQPPSVHNHPGSPFPEDPAVASALLRSMLGALEPVVIRLDADFCVRFISRIAPEYDISQVLGAHASTYVDAKSLPEAEACWHAALRGEHAFFRSELVASPGVRRFYEVWVGPYDGPDGRGVTLIAIEVTPYREQERILLQTEASLQMAQEATGIGLWSWDLVTNEVRWNDRMIEICGQSEALTLGDFTEKLIHPEDRDAIRAAGTRMLDEHAFSTPPYRILRADGTVRMVRTLGTPLRDKAGQLTGIVGGMLDVTAEHQREELARQRQRLESIGQLTAGIAHNFNNLLAAIIPTLQLLAPTAPPRLRLLADDALQSAVRAAEIVQQLSHYARQEARSPVSASRVAEPLGRAVRLCLGLFDPRVEIVQQIDASPMCVAVGDAELEQAVVNLLLNARDAVAGALSPRIDVTAGPEAPPLELGWTPADPEKGAVCIRVSDNGAGMSDDVRRRVFDPFFTTKEAGRGTGLGLATVEATVRRVGGIARCTSEEGKGATFELWLDARTPVERESEQALRPSLRGEGRIVLIVDDEQAIVRTTSLVLEDAGYRTVSASTCREALTRASEQTDISAVVLDRALADGNGVDIVEALRRRIPGVAVVLHSGHATSLDERRSVDAVLDKPATPAKLFETLAHALKKKAERG